MVEVGDAALVRAEPRDAQGNPLFDAKVTWRSLDPALVSVTVTEMSTYVTGLAPGIGRVAAQAGTISDTVTVWVPPPITATVLNVHLDTLETLGDSLVVRVFSQSDAGPRFGQYTVVTRNHTVAVVLDDPRPVTIVAVDPGTTWIVVTERHGTGDSLQVIVHQRPVSVTLPSDPITGYLGRTVQITAVAKDLRDNPIAGAEIAWRSTDPAVATVSSSGVVTFVGTGTGSIIASSPAGPADTGTVITRGPPPLVLGTASGATVVHTGTGLLSDTCWVEGASDALEPWVYLTVADTTVARAPDSVGYAGAGGTFRVVGRQPGTTLLIASAPQMAPDTAWITVSTASVSLVDWTFRDADVRGLPLGANADVAVRLQDSLGSFRNPAESVIVTLGSSDTSILTLPYREARIGPLDQGTGLFAVISHDTGFALVAATAPGFQPDTVRYQVTALPALLFQPGAVQTIGAGQMRDTQSPAGVTTTAGFERIGTAVPVTFARRNAGVASFPDTVTIPANSTGAPLFYHALVPGTDTIIATASGYDPDTLMLVVSTPHFILPDTVTGTVAAAWSNLRVGDSLNTIHATDAAVEVIATPADPTIALPSSTTIPSQFSWWWSLPFIPVDTGRTSVTVRDAAGGYTPKVITLAIVLDSTLRITGPGTGASTALAPRQRYPSGAFGVQGPGGHLVTLHPTDPGVLRVTDSLTLAGATPLSVAAGDVAGTSRIVAEAHGFVPDTSVLLTVAPGKLALEAPASGLVGGTGYTVAVTALSPEGFAFALDTTATFALVPLDAGLVVPAEARITTGDASSIPQALSFSASGTLRLAVEDHRPVPVPYAGDTVTITVAAPSLRLQPYPYPVVGVGQRLLAALERPWPVTAGALTVSVTSRTQRTASPATRTIPAGATSVEYGIEGRSVGPDTLIVSAPGHVPDTVAIWVSEGTVTVRDYPGTLRTGDSVRVVLEARDSAGGQHAVVGATTFAILGDGGLVFSDGQRSISSVIVPAGLGVTPPFWVKAVGPTGTARVRFYNLAYVEQVFTTNVAAAAGTSPP